MSTETMDELLVTRRTLYEMVQKRNFTHASVNIHYRIVLDMHETEWKNADEEIKKFVADNFIVVETWL